MHMAPLLLSAAAGYWVLERAEHERGRLKTVGRIVAWLVILLSFASVASHLCYAKRAMGGKFGCPFRGESAPQPAP